MSLHSSSLNRAMGFTLVELIVTILIIGILSVTVASRFVDNDGFAEFNFQNRLVSTLRDMQQRAMQDTRSGARYQINFDLSQQSFGAPTFSATTGFEGTNIDRSANVPVHLYVELNALTEEGITLSIDDRDGTSLSGSVAIGFDNLGRPLLNGVSASNGVRVSFVNQITANVCIEVEGYIHEGC